MCVMLGRVAKNATETWTRTTSPNVFYSRVVVSYLKCTSGMLATPVLCLFSQDFTPTLSMFTDSQPD